MCDKGDKKAKGFYSKPFLSKEAAERFRSGEGKRRAYASKVKKELDKALPYGVSPGLILKAN